MCNTKQITAIQKTFVVATNLRDFVLYFSFIKVDTSTYLTTAIFYNFPVKYSKKLQKLWKLSPKTEEENRAEVFKTFTDSPLPMSLDTILSVKSAFVTLLTCFFNLIGLFVSFSNWFRIKVSRINKKLSQPVWKQSEPMQY